MRVPLLRSLPERAPLGAAEPVFKVNADATDLAQSYSSAYQ